MFTTGLVGQEWTLTARWVFPVTGPPLPRGCVTIAGERLAAVEPHGNRTPDLDLGNVALLPGFVNAHTHLDLTGMRGLAPPTPDFTGWLRQVIAHRRSRSPEQVTADMHAGLAASLRSGVTLLGDIAAEGASWDILQEAPLRAVVFRELLGLTQDRAEQALTGARTWLETHPGTATCRLGLSPHAPYSARADLIDRARVLAQAHHAPVAVHLAESPAEMELLRHRRGPFVAFLQELGVWDPSGLAESPAQVLQSMTEQLAIPQLWIHGNYLAHDAALRPHDTVVYCPRTHAAFGHAPHPFREFFRRGHRVALGTDSLASNPDLSILAETRFLHQTFPELSGGVLLRMATLSGAEALGWQDETGSLEPGKSADLVVLPLPEEDQADPHHLVLATDLPVCQVLLRGRWLTDCGPPAGTEPTSSKSGI